VGWPAGRAELEEAQSALGRAAADATPWRRPEGSYTVGGAFVAFSTGRHLAFAGVERAWAAAVVFAEGRRVAVAVVAGSVSAGYEAGYLALRQGKLLEEAVRSLRRMPDVLLVNASGRDHPRRAGLALHVGAVVDLPTVGVTDRPLLAEGLEAGEEPGSASPLLLEGELVGYRLRTRRGARSVCAHAAWRTDPDVALEVVLAAVGRARTPEPLRVARFLARSQRARDEGRLPPGWTQDLLGNPRFPASR
jgi:deoxyribonuclease V